MSLYHKGNPPWGDGLRITTMPTRYHIRIKGHLDLSWSEWFEGLKISNEPDGTSDLIGAITDQAELIGILTKIHNLNLELISVNPEVAGMEQYHLK
jgi:hypothetical protein